MFGGDYAWILPDETIDLSGMTSDWWHVSSTGSGSTGCSSSQLAQALDGVIIVKSYDVTSIFQSNQSTSSGMVNKTNFNYLKLPINKLLNLFILK